MYFLFLLLSYYLARACQSGYSIFNQSLIVHTSFSCAYQVITSSLILSICLLFDLPLVVLPGSSIFSLADVCQSMYCVLLMPSCTCSNMTKFKILVCLACFRNRIQCKGLSSVMSVEGSTTLVTSDWTPGAVSIQFLPLQKLQQKKWSTNELIWPPGKVHEILFQKCMQNCKKCNHKVRIIAQRKNSPF